MKNRWLSLGSWLFASVLLVLLDWWTKQWAVVNLAGKEPIVLLNQVFELRYLENRGAAFGMFQGRQAFFFLIALVVFAACAYVMYRLPWKNRRFLFLRICVILLTAGAAGNMIDRVKQGYVVDFFYFRLIDFPIFNVADIYVTVSAFLLALLLLFYYKDEELEVLQLSGKKGRKTGDGKDPV